MPITVRDLAEAHLTLELRCRQCRRVVVLAPEILGRRFPLKMAFLDLVSRLRCSEDGMIPDVWLVFEDERVGREAMRRRLEVHRPRRGKDP